MIRGSWQLTGEGITGYALDENRRMPLWVELLANGESMGTALANLREPENFGFYFTIPPALLAEEVEFAIRIVNTDILLEPASHAEIGEEPALKGEFYLDKGLVFSGWVLDPAQSEQRLNIYAWNEDKQIAHTIAAGRYYRPAQADGHGFRIELPADYADGQMHIISFRDEKGRELPGSPVRICTVPDNTAEWLRKHKKFDKPLLDLVCNLVESVEERLPGALSLSKYPAWIKAFPPPQPPKGKMRLALSCDSPHLRKQQNVEIKKGNDFIFSAGESAGLHPNAIALMAETMKNYDAALVYADSETTRGEPIFKPAWDREAFFWQDYLGPCLICGSLAQHIQATPSEADRLNLILAAAEKGPVVHLPVPLSFTPIPAHDSSRTPQIDAWLKNHLPNAGMTGEKLRFNTQKPLISIIIPTRDHGDLLKTCLDSLWKTTWPNLEIIILDNDTVEDDALAVLTEAAAHANVRILKRPGVFNYAAMNNDAVRNARGDLVCFLNNDTEAIDPHWLDEMAGVLLGLEAGCVGAKLLWPNGLVQHGGVIVGPHQLAAHVGNQWLADEPGYLNRNLFLQQYSAVTAACMLTSKNLFLELGGFDSKDFPIAFNDVDYCLKVGKAGKKIYWTPDAVLMHHESASRSKDLSGQHRARGEREMRIFRSRWGTFKDPFYNPNLHLSAAAEPFCGLAFPPRPRTPRAG